MAVVVFKELCKGCGICAGFCPRGVLRMSEEVNSRGFRVPAVVDESRCTGCGLCELLCPDYAIAVRRSGGGGAARVAAGEATAGAGSRRRGMRP